MRQRTKPDCEDSEVSDSMSTVQGWISPFLVLKQNLINQILFVIFLSILTSRSDALVAAEPQTTT